MIRRQLQQRWRASLAATLLAGGLAACGMGTDQGAVPNDPAAPIVEPTTALAEPTIGLAEPTTTTAEEMPATPLTGSDASEGGMVDFSELADNPEAFYGQQVTISGDVVELLGRRSLLVNDPALLGFDSLLVFGSNPDIFVREGDTVQITGEVREFNLGEIENDIDFDLRDETFSSYDQQPVIVADMIEATGTTESREVTLSNIIDEAEAYAGRTVVVSGDVTERVGQQAFQLNDNALLSGDSLLVIPANPDVLPNNVDLFAEDAEINLRLSGTVRMFNQSELQQQLGLSLEEDLFSEFEGQPVLIAQAINVPLTLGEIAENAETYEGRRVSIDGFVGDWLDDQRGFTLTEEGLLQGDDVLVIPTSEALMPREEDGAIRVTGVVRSFDLEAINTEYNLDLDPLEFGEWNDRTVILADSIAPINTSTSDTTGAAEGAIENLTARPTQDAITGPTSATTTNPTLDTTPDSDNDDGNDG